MKRESSANSARDRAIVDAYRASRTAAEVGAEFGLTKARVGQGIAQYEEANGEVKRHRRGPLRKDAIPMEARVCGGQECENIFHVLASDTRKYCSLKCRKVVGRRKNVDVAAMLADYMSGMTLKQVGEKHGVSYSVVYQRLRENHPSVVRPPGRFRKRWQLEQARRLLSELTQDELRQLLAY
jgi:hypothetical protein